MAFRKYFSFIFVLSVVSIIWVFYLNPSTKNSTQSNVKPLQFQPRLYQINNITVDFSLASIEFENKVLQYFRQSPEENTVSFYRISNETKSQTISVTISPSLPTSFIDILVVSNAHTTFNSRLQRTSYILFEETIDTSNFTFEFVQVNREWSHFFPPVIFVDAVTRINLFHLETPVILLKRAPPEFRPIINTLWELQHPNDCENVLYVRIRDEVCGMGCAVHFIHHGFQVALHFRRPYAVPGYWKWLYNSPECMEHYLCYWLRIPLGCNYNDSTARKEMASLDPTIKFEANETELMVRAAIHFFSLKVNPSLYESIKSTYAFLDSISNHTFYPCIAVHIRRGDKEAEALPKPTEAYVTAVQKINSTFPGNWSILLMTDDLLVPHEFTWMLEGFPVYVTNTSTHRVNDGKMNFRRGLDFLNEVYMASICDHFVGTFSSNVGRLIAEIQRGNGYGKSISLDTKYRLYP